MRQATPLLFSALLFASSASSALAQEFYEPSLPVPVPSEDAQQSQQSGDYYAVAAIDGSVPRAFDARRQAAEVAARRARTETISQLRTLPPSSPGYYVKAGSFRSFENAQQLHASLFAIGSAQITHRKANGQDFYGVYLGPWRNEAQAKEAFILAMDAGMQDGAIVPPRTALTND